MQQEKSTSSRRAGPMAVFFFSPARQGCGVEVREVRGVGIGGRICAVEQSQPGVPSKQLLI